MYNLESKTLRNNYKITIKLTTIAFTVRLSEQSQMMTRGLLMTFYMGIGIYIRHENIKLKKKYRNKNTKMDGNW